MSAQAIQTPDQQALARTWVTIDGLGLNDNLIELDTRGYTIVRASCPGTRWSAPRPRS